MRIVEVQVFRFSSPLRDVFTTAFYSSSVKESVIVKLRSDDGVVGFGESTPFQYAFGENVDVSAYVIERQLAPKLVGRDPFNLEEISTVMEKTIAGFYYAKCAVDFALYDLIAKSLGLPLHRLIGGKNVEKVPVAWVIGIKEVDRVVEEAEKAKSSGFREVKLKADRRWRRVVDAVKAIKERFGDELEVRVDANQSWSVDEAKRAISRLDRYDVQAVEQPVPAWNIEGLAEVRRSVSTPIMADEAIRTPSDAIRIVKAEAADILNLKIGPQGGIYRCLKTRAIAEAAGLKCVIGSCLEGHLGTGAMVHFASATKNLLSTDLVGPLLRAERITVQPLNFAEGFYEVLEKPGVGVEVDETRLKRR